MASNLKGKKTLIVGASSGIGAAVAKRFGALGAPVIVHYFGNKEGAVATVEAILAAGGWATMMRADASDPDATTRLIDNAVAELGGLDVLINNAGDMMGRTPIADIDDEKYKKVLDLNIGSVFFAARRAAQIFRDGTKGGTIINTTSIAARNGGGGGAGLYASTKAFVSNITRTLAKELAPYNVRVNGVAPGVILTAFHERNSTPEQLAPVLQTIPMGRFGTSEDCVGAYEFLADETMSGYITGQIIEVNGGQLMP